MQLGVGLPSFASQSHILPPNFFHRYARRAESHGFARAWTIEHLVRPPTYATSVLEPLTTLSFVAGQTETLPVGSSVLVLPLRNPVLTAKRAATIQHLSGQRLTLGLGTGYVRAEFEAVGIPLEERSKRFREAVALLQRLFTEDEVTFDGEFYSVSEFRLEPALSEPPRLLAGGGGVETEDGRRIASTVCERLLHTDGWIATSGSPDELEHDWNAFADYLAGKGLDPTQYDKVGFQYLHLVPDEDPDAVRNQQRTVYADLVGEDRSVDHAMENWLTGTVTEIKDVLAAYEQLGFDEVVLHPATHEPANLDRQLKLFAEHLLTAYN